MCTVESSEAILKALFDESESILFQPFFINFNFDFGILARKCLKPCVNGVLKFQFFFLNLSSKVLAGVRVRTSKYPYMDICVLSYDKNVNHLVILHSQGGTPLFGSQSLKRTQVHPRISPLL